MTLEQRFWAKVSVGGPNKCWEWTGAKDRNGRGQIHLGVGRRLSTAPRVAWLIEHGEVPRALYVLHHCDNPACVNLAHLFLGSQHDNMVDSARKNRVSRTVLSISDVRWMREWHAVGWHVKQLAAAVGTSIKNARGILTGTKRKWV